MIDRREGLWYENGSFCFQSRDFPRAVQHASQSFAVLHPSQRTRSRHERVRRFGNEHLKARTSERCCFTHGLRGERFSVSERRGSTTDRAMDASPFATPFGGLAIASDSAGLEVLFFPVPIPNVSDGMTTLKTRGYEKSAAGPRGGRAAPGRSRLAPSGGPPPAPGLAGNWRSTQNTHCVAWDL
jgi:hypothetical protein